MSVVTVFSGIDSVAKIPSQSSQPSRKGKDRMKTVQIPYELFVALLRYHLLEDDCCAEEIHQGLEQKLDSLVRHELYKKYKTALHRRNGKKPGRNILTDGECRTAFAGNSPLLVIDRSVSRSCG